MPNQPVDTSRALDGAIAIRVHSRHEALLHDARGEGIHLLDVMLGLAALCTLAALFLGPQRAGVLTIVWTNPSDVQSGLTA